MPFVRSPYGTIILAFANYIVKWVDISEVTFYTMVVWFVTYLSSRTIDPGGQQRSENYRCDLSGFAVTCSPGSTKEVSCDAAYQNSRK